MEQHRTGAYGYRKDDLSKRLGRIEGQIRGIARMVDEEQYCVDILTQIAAVRAALDGVSVGLLEDHMNGCLRDSVEAGDAREKLTELMGVIERFVALRR
jgi:CsoR family transcriptional regulator, copper-sensing transcriptional repressor